MGDCRVINQDTTKEGPMTFHEEVPLPAGDHPLNPEGLQKQEHVNEETSALDGEELIDDMDARSQS